MEKSIWQFPLNVLQKFLFFRKSQYWSKDKLHEFQSKKIRELIQHAFANVPYYRDIFEFSGIIPDDIKTIDDLHKLPVLDKEIVRRNSNKLTADNARSFGLNWDSTSGSSGKPLHFITDNATQSAKIAALLRSYNWSGYKIGSKMLSMQSYYFPDSDYKFNRMYNVLRFDSNRLSRISLLKLIEECERWQPHFIMGFPFDIVMLAKTAEEAGKSIKSVRSVITYGETLSRTKRVILEDYFRCKVFNFFSLHECAALISECEEGNLHLVDDFAYHEVLDNQNKRVNTGIGTLYGTSYFNLAMPFIRYNIGDAVRINDVQKSCGCGRPFPLIDEIIGKQCDFIETPDGRFLGAVMSHSIDNAKGVVCSQCVQNSIDHILVNLITDADFDINSNKDLEEGLRKRLGNQIRIEFKKVDQLIKLDNGKTPFIISNIGNKYI